MQWGGGVVEGLHLYIYPVSPGSLDSIPSLFSKQTLPPYTHSIYSDSTATTTVTMGLEDDFKSIENAVDGQTYVKPTHQLQEAE